ncbi:hypothetical protein EON63_02660 [archaeon]|nr:MAG: hypothetical protein EON63_02660 [archaeon]
MALIDGLGGEKEGLRHLLGKLGVVQSKQWLDLSVLLAMMLVAPHHTKHSRKSGTETQANRGQEKGPKTRNPENPNIAISASLPRKGVIITILQYLTMLIRKVLLVYKVSRDMMLNLVVMAWSAAYREARRTQY